MAPAFLTLTPPGSSPYWDNGSFDARTSTAGCNIGWIVTGGSLAGCSDISVAHWVPAIETQSRWGLKRAGAGSSRANTIRRSFLNHTDNADAVEFEVSLAGDATQTRSGSALGPMPPVIPPVMPIRRGRRAANCFSTALRAAAIPPQASLSQPITSSYSTLQMRVPEQHTQRTPAGFSTSRSSPRIPLVRMVTAPATSTLARRTRAWRGNKSLHDLKNWSNDVLRLRLQ